MGRLVGLTMIVLVVACGVAHGADGRKQAANVERWEAVEGLKPGTEINVLSGNQAGPDLCLVSSVDDSALTCLLEDAARDVRLVIPRSAVRDVWAFEKARDRHVWVWIGVAVAVGLGVAMIVEGGILGAAVLCAVGIAIEGVDARSQGPIWMPQAPPPPKPPRWRRRLVYHAQQKAVSP